MFGLLPAYQGWSGARPEVPQWTARPHRARARLGRHGRHHRPWPSKGLRPATQIGTSLAKHQRRPSTLRLPSAVANEPSVGCAGAAASNGCTRRHTVVQMQAMRRGRAGGAQGMRKPEASSRWAEKDSRRARRVCGPGSLQSGRAAWVRSERIQETLLDSECGPCRGYDGGRGVV